MVLPFQVALFSGVSVAALMASAGADAYAVGGNAPEFVADFAGTLNSGTEYYRSGGSDTTFSSVFTHSGLVAPATMTDSDGVLKWAPHNICTYSEDFTNWSTVNTTITSNTTTAPDGTSTADTIIHSATASSPNWRYNSFATAATTYRFKVRVKENVSGGHLRFIVGDTTLSNFVSSWYNLGTNAWGSTSDTGTYTRVATGTPTSLGDGWYEIYLDVTSPGGNATFYFYIATANGGFTRSTTASCYMWGAQIHRISLGGMVNAPSDQQTYSGDASYLRTTTAAKFLPRRNHYLYNGSTYDNAGILIESAAATNLATYSNTFTDAAWSTNAANETLTASASTGPDGATSMTRLNDDSGTGTGEVYVDQAVTVATSTAYTFSVYAKADQLSWIALGAENFTTPANGESFFNLSAGTVGTAATGHTARIENVASGIYRCSITFTTDASDTSGNIRIYVADADTDITVDRDGTSSAYIYGAQFEAGSVPTSYIPVAAGSTVTRAAETLTVAGATFDAKQSGTIHVGLEWPYPEIDTNATALALVGSGADLVFASFTPNQFSFQANAINATVTGLSAGTTNVVGRWDSSVAEHALCVNGGSVVSSGPNATYTLPAHNATFVDGSVGQIRTLRIVRHWETVELTDAQMQSASS